MEAQDSLSHVLQHTLQLAHEHIQEAIFSRHVLESTVDTTIEAALCTIDTLFVARESEVAVAPTALMNSSWEPEPEPQPCSMDTWLRAAIPESTAVKPSYLMHEFLQTSTPAVPHPHSTESHALGRSSREVVQHSQSGAGAAPAPPAATATGHEKAARGGKSRGEGPMPRLMASKQLTPEQAAAEDRLREELEIRKAQLAVRNGNEKMLMG